MGENFSYLEQVNESVATESLYCLFVVRFGASRSEGPVYMGK